MENNLNQTNTALLVMDVQGATIKIVGENSPLLPSLAKAIKKARSKNIPVIYVVIGFRKGFPEVRKDSRSYSMMQSMNMDTAAASKVYDAVAPMENEIVITKKRVSAFSGSDLEVVLRAMRIDHLILTGIATSGVVLSTLREAADKDFKLTVLSDCCADRDEEVHRALTTKVFVRQADVITVDEWKP